MGKHHRTKLKDRKSTNANITMHAAEYLEQCAVASQSRQAGRSHRTKLKHRQSSTPTMHATEYLERLKIASHSQKSKNQDRERRNKVRLKDAFDNSYHSNPLKRKGD